MRPRLTYANVMATLAVFIALGGTAYAVNTVGSADVIDESLLSQDIKNGEVKVADVGQGAVATDEIANGQVKASDIGDDEVKTTDLADGQVRVADIGPAAVASDELANGQVQAEDLAPGVAPGASGARAWGLVDSDGTLLRSKQVTSVSHAPGSNVYCIDPAPGINVDTAVMVVGGTLLSDPGSDATIHIDWAADGSGCPAQTMAVHTFLGFGSPASLGEIDHGGFDLLAVDLSFAFAIP